MSLRRPGGVASPMLKTTSRCVSAHSALGLHPTEPQPGGGADEGALTPDLTPSADQSDERRDAVTYNWTGEGAGVGVAVGVGVGVGVVLGVGVRGGGGGKRGEGTFTTLSIRAMLFIIILFIYLNLPYSLTRKPLRQ